MLIAREKSRSFMCDVSSLENLGILRHTRRLQELDQSRRRNSTKVCLSYFSIEWGPKGL